MQNVAILAASDMCLRLCLWCSLFIFICLLGSSVAEQLHSGELEFPTIPLPSTPMTGRPRPISTPAMAKSFHYIPLVPKRENWLLTVRVCCRQNQHKAGVIKRIKNCQNTHNASTKHSFYTKQSGVAQSTWWRCRVERSIVRSSIKGLRQTEKIKTTIARIAWPS